MRVLIVDPHPVCRQGLSAILNDRFGPCQIICADDLASIPEGLGADPPDLAVIDGDVVGREGPAFEALIAAIRPRPLIVMNARPEPAVARRALAMGARGFIPKTYSPDLIAAAIGLVAAGSVYFPSEGEQARTGAPGLTARQREVLERLADGLSNLEIAQQLGISVGTVKLHLHRAFAAIGVKNRIQAAMWVRQRQGAAVV